jgi:hypothetical protein
MADLIEEQQKALARGREAAAAIVVDRRPEAALSDGEKMAALRLAIQDSLRAPAPKPGAWSRAYSDGQRDALLGVLKAMRVMGV